MLLYHISQKENKFTECGICKLRISQNMASLTPEIKTRGLTAWQWRGDKVHLQQQRCVLNCERDYVTAEKCTPSWKKYPCLTLGQAITQLFNQSNNQLVIHQSIYQSDNLVSQWNSQSVISESFKQSVKSNQLKSHSVSFLCTCINLSTFKSVSESHCQPVNPTVILSIFQSTMQSVKQ